MKSGKQRSVWMTDEEWLSIKESAKLSRRTISQYLLFLHQSDVQVFPKTVEDVREKLDDIIDRKTPEKPLKEGLIVNIEEPKVGTGGTGDHFFRPYSKAHQTRKTKRG